jgi:hypothetical protein
MKLPVNYNETPPKDRRAVREEYVRVQNGLCAHCGAPLNGKPSLSVARTINPSLFPDKFFFYPVHLHHSHDTGMTIGAVHAHCNAILWQYHRE